VTPDRIAGASLEDTERVRRGERLALVGRKSAGRKLAVSGQSMPGFNWDARMPAPYSPVSK
jgi:hypothetical protein